MWYDDLFAAYIGSITRWVMGARIVDSALLLASYCVLLSRRHRMDKAILRWFSAIVLMFEIGAVGSTVLNEYWGRTAEGVYDTLFLLPGLIFLAYGFPTIIPASLVFTYIQLFKGVIAT
ncbi:hypothetical protein KIPB_007767, partial [Kipferlia bialata]|eukprot:g7767.t1